LNRPDKLNPLSTATLEELVAAARWFDARPAVKVVVIAGNGRAFSAGADLAAFAAAANGAAAMREAADAGRRMADAIEAMRAVTVVRLHGHCVGGGVVLAAACDLRVAAENTRFSIPEVDLGIPLAWGGVPRLVREIGPSLTKELVMTCRPFDAAEAKAAGFVNRVVPEADLDAAVDELVEQLVGKSVLRHQASGQRGGRGNGGDRAQLERRRRAGDSPARSRVAGCGDGLSGKGEPPLRRRRTGGRDGG
jgi:enoyl-CoA hydratase/3-hydroxypropionyl-coenzyme A dehydratase